MLTGPCGRRKFIPLHAIAQRGVQKRAERAIQRTSNEEVVATQEDPDPSSEESMELHRRDPCLHNGRQLGRGMLAELSFETDVLVAPSPIETDPVMRAGCQHGGTCSSPRRSPRREPKPNRVTDPKVNLSAILQLEGLTKAEADQFSSSWDPDDDQDSNFGAFLDPTDAGSEAGGGEDVNDNKEASENAGEEEAPDETAGDNGGSGGPADDASAEVPGGGGSSGSGNDDGDDNEEGGGEKESGDEEENDDEEEEGEEDDAPAKETPRAVRLRPRMRPKTPPKDPSRTKRSRKQKPGQCFLSRCSTLPFCRVTKCCCPVTSPSFGCCCAIKCWFS